MKRAMVLMLVIGVLLLTGAALLLLPAQSAQAMPIQCDFYTNSSSVYWPGYGYVCMGNGDGCWDCYWLP